ncbi:MAG: hypothetical protein JWM20_831 [Patescibacteria group bacterium]|nr:hypothetical protein [Patescibacteria group bacterium]
MEATVNHVVKSDIKTDKPYGTKGKRTHEKLHKLLLRFSPRLAKLLDLGREKGSAHLKHIVRICKRMLRLDMQKAQGFSKMFDAKKAAEAIEKQISVKFTDGEKAMVNMHLQEMMKEVKIAMRNELNEFEKAVLVSLQNILEFFHLCPVEDFHKVKENFFAFFGDFFKEINPEKTDFLDQPLCAN